MSLAPSIPGYPKVCLIVYLTLLTYSTNKLNITFKFNTKNVFDVQILVIRKKKKSRVTQFDFPNALYNTVHSVT